MQSNTYRSYYHYTIAALLLTIYGLQVCPFLETLSPLALLTSIIVAFVAMALVRQYWLSNNLKSNAEGFVSKQFRLDIILFVIASLSIDAFNQWFYDFPLESTGKLLTGMASLGFMISIDLALHSEKILADNINSGKQTLAINDNIFPIHKKFISFAATATLATVIILFMVVSKDLDWLMHDATPAERKQAQRYILGEFGFIAAVLVSYLMLVIHSYANNIRNLLKAEHNVLSAVTSGDLDARVAVVSNDEFGQIANHTNQTISSLKAKTEELNQTRDATILSLASLAETRDNETGAHIQRTQHYIKVLAEHLKSHPRFREYLTEDNIDLLFKSAPLHDAGKVGIPDAILLKPGKLTDEEFEIMKQHPTIGAESLAVAEDVLGTSNSFLHMAQEICASHHEKWDGSGYPKGLSGDDIPFSGRLMALADVYDALISKRVYKPGFSHEKSKAIILEGKNKHFDPDIVDAFVACEQQFVDIASTYQDNH